VKPEGIGVFMKHFLLLLVSLLVLESSLNAQQRDSLRIALDDPIVAMIDSLMKKEHIRRDAYVKKPGKSKYGYAADYVPDVSDSLYKVRVEQMNSRTPFEYAFNDDVLAYIRLYTEKRRSFTSIAMARSAMYFPLFEEKLAKYDLPLELKYLSVIESALNPVAKSPAGAMGLWQFMLATGKMYNLEVDSYLDERRDPIKATESACQLLKSLHSYYNDWSMALAAYNAGPGTVNRAIRRSGGKMTYWEIRQFLPKETQGYVPAFIAVNYAMEYHEEHNIQPRVAEKRYYDVDTVHIKEPLNFNHLSAMLKLPKDYLQEINPVYKTDHIPFRQGKKNYLYLPVEKIGLFMANEDSLYAMLRKPKVVDEPYTAYTSSATHTVKSGEYLSLIANKYGCTVDEIISWNNLTSNVLHVGQKLQIRQTTKVPVEKQETTTSTNTATNSGNQTTQSTNTSTSTASTTNLSADSYIYYTIKQGDTLWAIAQSKGVSLTQLKQWNKGINERDLKVGSKIRVGIKG
jgi:membrane-bound lytic murein transglycosylase D